MKKFWNIKAKGEKIGELTLYGAISDETWYGDEVTPKKFGQELAALGELERLDIYINSPGGDVFAGFAIHNMIKRCAAEVVAHVDGLAASAASIVCMAADKIVMPKTASMMIHNAAAETYGNKTKLRKMADELERVDGQMAEIYAERSGMDVAEAARMMDEETWMTGEEALALGLCDELDEMQAVACAGLEKYGNVYRNMPEELKKEKPDRNEDYEGNANGGESEPVADKKNQALSEQRERLWNLRKKINGGV